MSNYIDQFSELLSNPLGDLISSIGRGVGEAQAALDSGSLEQSLEIYRVVKNDSKLSEEENKRIKETKKLLREIGYQPTFYVLPETEVEAQVSLSLTINASQSQNLLQQGFKARHKIMATPINAGNINRYNLGAQASAKIKFKLVPVPPASEISTMRVVPDLVGESLDFSTSLLNSLGLEYIIDGSNGNNYEGTGSIESTVPEKDIVVRHGDVIELKISNP
ncbi:MAG: PASTA domain-containing protein [Bacteroidales bacterium]|jgi:hypothetical protein|nr:PASTA domain-containing protein [Bacteroidales bacterium]